MTQAPIDMVLYCPSCHTQHVDAPEDSSDWTNPPHRSHLCHNCGHVWRPADVPTNGVAFIMTSGKNDNPIASDPNDPKTLEWIAKFGEENRRLIVNAVRYLDEAEPRWGLLEPFDRDAYIENLIARRAK